MGEEWVPTKVADLKMGDEVRDIGTLGVLEDCGDQRQVRFSGPRGGGTERWPTHAIVDVHRPALVTVEQMTLATSFHAVRIDGKNVASFRSMRHAECYAEKLRNRPKLRAEALGRL